MLLYPHELKKAQDEIDRVLGRNRLPNIDDRPSLPYLECVLKEVVRWAFWAFSFVIWVTNQVHRMNPMVPLGMPHRLMEDDFYRDFYIPEGTNVLANI